MRFFFISDLHIKAGSHPETTIWVSRFCNYLNENAGVDPILVFVLGDVIDRGDPDAFDTADTFFQYIKITTSQINVHFFFLPGNHDYCDGDLSPFQSFCHKHQSDIASNVSFTEKSTWNIEIGQMNFILTDSLRGQNYDQPGKLDLLEIRNAFVSGKTNILLLHHRLMFEDATLRAGVVDQSDVIKLLISLGISFVFQGHAHYSNRLNLFDNIHFFGVGSMGVDTEDLKWIENENDQFVVMTTDQDRVESVVNLLYRGGERRFTPLLIYPQQSVEYSDGTGIPMIEYQAVDNYIPRKVMQREEAQDLYTRFFSAGKKSSLIDVCLADKYTLLIADAAIGKSIELQNLANSLTEKGGVGRPVLLLLRDYSGIPIQDYINRQYPSYATLNPRRFLLIMDGYDELDAENAKVFRRELKKYIQENSETHICISMRSNFYKSSAEAFSGFSAYQLLDLDRNDINSTLCKKGIDPVIFRQQCELNNLDQLIGSPLYLDELITIYLETGSLPPSGQLMANIIESHIQRDCRKFEYAENLEDQTVEMVKSLTRLAFGMQLLETSRIADREYQKLLRREDRELLKYCSLKVTTHDGHEFLHNVFKEYLAAKCLSEQPLSTISSYVFIEKANALNSSWFNVLGFVIQMRQDEDLIQWLYQIEPLAITRFERDRITDSMRYEVLRFALEKVEKDNIWLSKSLCDPTRLAKFAQSLDAVELLVAGIRSPVSFRALSACLSILSHFDELYGREIKVREVLVQCYNSEITRSYEKRIAIEAIAELGLQTPEITAELVKRFASGVDTEERQAIYSYLLKSNQINENIDLVLSALTFLFTKRDEDEMYYSELYKLQECLKEVSSPLAVEKVVHWLACSESNDYSHGKLLHDESILILKKAEELYNNGYADLFDSVFLFFEDAVSFSVIHYKEDIVQFFKCTNTIEKMIERLSEAEIKHRSYLIRMLIDIDPTIVDSMYALYERKRICSSFFKELVEVLPNGESFKKCANIYRINTGEVVAPLSKPIDYSERERNSLQRYWNSLFDQSIAEDLLSELLTFFGANVTIGELKIDYSKYYDYTPGLVEFVHTIRKTHMDDKKASDFFEVIDKESYFKGEVVAYLGQNKGNKICVSDEQKQCLNKLYQELERRFDIRTQYKEDGNSIRYSWDLHDYLVLKRFFSWDSSERIMLDLLELPAFMIVAQDGKEVQEKYCLIESKVEKTSIIGRVIKAVSRQEYKHVLEDLFFGCIRYQLQEGKQAALRFCARTDVEDYDKRHAVEYLATVLGPAVIVDEILPNADDKLFKVCLPFIRETEGESINKLIIEHYRANKDKELIREMLFRNMPEGIKLYILESRKSNRPLDDSEMGFPELTDMIGELSNPVLIPILVEAVIMLCEPDFMDAKYSSLYQALLKAFCNCAESSYDEVISVLTHLRTENFENKDLVNFCSTTIEQVNYGYAERLKKRWSIPEIVDEISGIRIVV